MIAVTNVNPNNVITYHEEPRDAADKLAAIRDRDEYSSLKSSIEKDGFLDPILIRCEQGRTYVEIGEQRVLIARDLGTESLKAIIYTVKGVDFPSGFELTKLNNIDELEAEFSRTTMTVMQEVDIDPITYTGTMKEMTVTVPSLKTIKDYLEHGLIIF